MLKSVLAEAVAWSEQVGQMQLAYFENKNYEIRSKNQPVDFVTEIDLRSEKELRSLIWSTYPNHLILGEEDEGIQNSDGQTVIPKLTDYQWVIDPIDGTTNFIHGFPFFCISLGLKYQGQTCLGVVHAPALGRTFTSIRGQGAYLNGQQLTVANRTELVDSVIATGFPYDRAKGNVNLPYFSQIVNQVAGIRRTGSAALDLCFVAEGGFDGYWEFGVNEWDICAGVLLVEEAGGVTGLHQKHGKSLLIAGNSAIQNKLSSYFFNNEKA